MRLGIVATDTTMRLHGAMSAAVRAASRETWKLVSTASASRTACWCATDASRDDDHSPPSHAPADAASAASTRAARARSSTLGDATSDDATP